MDQLGGPVRNSHDIRHRLPPLHVGDDAVDHRPDVVVGVAPLDVLPDVGGDDGVPGRGEVAVRASEPWVELEEVLRAVAGVHLEVEVGVAGPADVLEQAWPAIGVLTQVKVRARDGNGAWGGRATSVRITGSQGSVNVSGDTFRSVLGLRSTWIRFR